MKKLLVLIVLAIFVLPFGLRQAEAESGVCGINEVSVVVDGKIVCYTTDSLVEQIATNIVTLDQMTDGICTFNHGNWTSREAMAYNNPSFLGGQKLSEALAENFPSESEWGNSQAWEDYYHWRESLENVSPMVNIFGSETIADIEAQFEDQASGFHGGDDVDAVSICIKELGSWHFELVAFCPNNGEIYHRNGEQYSCILSNE